MDQDQENLVADSSASLPADEPETEDNIVYPTPNDDGEGDDPMFGHTAMIAVKLAMGLRRVRIEKGMAIKDAAQRAGLNVSLASRLENGKIRNPKLDTLVRYGVAVGLELVVDWENISVEFQGP